ncbi:MAG: type III ribulose-bisphosphate carboxylase [archaeon]
MKYANQDKYLDLKFNPDPDKYVLADFYMECGAEKACAAGLAAESSTGTWTKVTTTKRRIDRLAAKVYKLRGNQVKVAYPVDIFEDGNIPQLLSDVAGNIFGMKIVKNLRLNDLTFPKSYLKTFKGPQFGMEGVRKIIGTSKSRRPHCGTIVKPKVGLNPEETASVAYHAWAGGLDLVKDDENLTSQKFCPFEDRVIKVLAAMDLARSETGEKKIYCANITGVNMAERAQFVKDHGGNCIMIDILTAGYAATQEIRNINFGMPIHAHRAMHAAITRNRRHGISMLVLAKLARLSGVDQLHIGTAVGKMEGPVKEIKEIHDAMYEQLAGIKSVFSVCSGGIHPGHVEPLVKNFGKDIVIQAGGGIHGHPGGTLTGARAMRQAVEAVAKGKTLKEYAKNHIELDTALGKWSKV